jgi:hypothetical protein
LKFENICRNISLISENNPSTARTFDKTKARKKRINKDGMSGMLKKSKKARVQQVEQVAALQQANGL